MLWVLTLIKIKLSSSATTPTKQSSVEASESSTSSSTNQQSPSSKAASSRQSTSHTTTTATSSESTTTTTTTSSKSSPSKTSSPDRHNSAKKKQQSQPPYSPAQIVKLESQRAEPRPAKLCSYCTRPENSNKKGVFDKFLTCSECATSAHASDCLNYAPAMIDHILTTRLPWFCIECKRCVVCLQTCESLLLCDRCDRGFHTECCQPPLAQIPSGSYLCHVCKWEDAEKEKLRAAAASNLPDNHDDNLDKPLLKIKKKKKTNSDDTTDTNSIAEKPKKTKSIKLILLFLYYFSLSLSNFWYQKCILLSIIY